MPKPDDSDDCDECRSIRLDVVLLSSCHSGAPVIVRRDAVVAVRAATAEESAVWPAARTVLVLGMRGGEETATQAVRDDIATVLAAL